MWLIFVQMEQADVFKETKQFTYKDGSQFVFMDLVSFIFHFIIMFDDLGY